MSTKLCNVSKTFGQKTVIRDLSYTFEDKGLYVILGGSGSGKTTLLRLLAGLDTPTEGTIKRDGKISFAFQEYRLFSHLDALENVTKILSEIISESDVIRASGLLSDLGFSDDELHLFPHQLSGGMKQRVNLVRAFAYPSSLLLLDEPFKELDEKLKEKVARYIEKESENRTVIVVLHELNNVFKSKPIILDLK